jgi:protein-disulfide isomerase
MKRENWRIIAASSIGGAVLALIVIFEFGSAGLVPLNKAATERTVHDYLVAHPEILIDMTAKLQANQEQQTRKERQAATDKLGQKAFFDPKVAFITGPANAKTTVVEFFDYNCPFCRASVPALKKFYEKHRHDTRFAFIEFPIKGQDSVDVAHAAIAARKQPDKYIAFHFALMSEDGHVDAHSVLDAAKKAGLDIARLRADMKDPKIDSEIAAANKLAEAAKIDGTPAFIINGKMREGAIDAKLLAQMAKG